MMLPLLAGALSPVYASFTSPKIKTIRESRLVYRIPGETLFREWYFADEVFGYSRIWFKRLEIDTVHYLSAFDSIGNKVFFAKIDEKGDTVFAEKQTFEYDEMNQLRTETKYSRLGGEWKLSEQTVYTHYPFSRVRHYINPLSTKDSPEADSVVYDLYGRESELYQLQYGAWWLNAFYNYDNKGRLLTVDFYTFPTDYRIGGQNEIVYSGDSLVTHYYYEYRANETTFDTLLTIKTFDSRERLTGQMFIYPDKSIRDHYLFDYDSSGFMMEKFIFHRQEDKWYILSKEYFENERIGSVIYESSEIKSFYTQVEKDADGNTITTHRLKHPFFFSQKKKHKFYRYWKRFRLLGRPYDRSVTSPQGLVLEQARYGMDYDYWSFYFYTYTFY